MAHKVIHISEAEAANDFAGVLRTVRSGAEVVIEKDHEPVAVVRPPAAPAAATAERIALLPENSTAVIDEDFAKDVAAAVESHREPLEPPAWD